MCWIEEIVPIDTSKFTPAELKKHVAKEKENEKIAALKAKKDAIELAKKMPKMPKKVQIRTSI
jgi:hypothetical protein